MFRYRDLPATRVFVALSPLTCDETLPARDKKYFLITASILQHDQLDLTKRCAISKPIVSCQKRINVPWNSFLPFISCATPALELFRLNLFQTECCRRQLQVGNYLRQPFESQRQALRTVVPGAENSTQTKLRSA